MSVIHRGHELTQPQLDCFTIILNEQMNGKHRGQAKLEAALEANERAPLFKLIKYVCMNDGSFAFDHHMKLR